jgi:hypothetical protein
MESASITNYDVLVEPPSLGGQSGDYQLAKHKNHVGNNRLEVFLNLYQQAYDGASIRGDFNECNGLVDKIVSTVCHQCVPRGRFLVSASAGGDNGTVVWNQMDEGTAKALLHKVLQPPPGMKSTNTGTAKDDEGLKRRRRSSLLRRSASEGMVSLVQDDKKKVNRNCGIDNIDEARGDTHWKSARSTNRNQQFTLSRMDVILTSSGNALDPNSQSVGNNRLHILIAMETGNYQQSSPDGKERKVDEVLKTVKMFWKGRFLVKEAFSYEELDTSRAREALKSIFAMRSGQRPPIQRSTLMAPTIAALPQRAGLYKQASMTMIPSDAATETRAAIPDLQNMRSAAVKSLQKQKARQNIAHRLEKITRRSVSAPEPPPEPQSVYEQNLVQSAAFSGNKFRATAQKRESTVLGKLDSTVMEQLVADFNEYDFDNDNDDEPEPLPPSNANQFGNKFTGRNGNGLR